MENYANIIEDVISTPKTRELVRKMIPILINWAMNGEIEKTYKDMIRELGYVRYSGIGRTLGCVEDVMNQLRKLSGKKNIPSLNALCRNSYTHLPSDGFSYVYPNYNKLSIPEKQKIVAGHNIEVVQYKDWFWVLNVLGLKPAPTLTDDEWHMISEPVYGTGGEGREHKALKEYIKDHPEELGLHNVRFAEIEHLLPFGDRLDVFFILSDGTNVAVEVKPSTSPLPDVSRGIFQCVKYAATMEAERRLKKESYNIQTYLILGADIDDVNKKIADVLKIKYIVVRLNRRPTT